MTIYKRVKIKSTNLTSFNKVKRTQNQTQYYLIKIEEKSYVSVRSTFSEMKRFSFVKFQRINALLNRQNAQLLAKLDQCRERNVHSNIEEQLTNVDIKQMS
jgi:hypothetical protein